MFLTIGNSSDFTFSLIKTSKINLLIESQYRKLFDLGDLILESAFLPSSGNNSIKGFLKIKGNARLDQSTFLNVDTTLISDTSF